MTENRHNYLKWVSLVVLIAQTTALVLFFRFAKTHQTPGEPGYVNSAVVLTAEIVKFVSCVAIIFINNKWSWRRFVGDFQRDVFKAPGDTLKVGVPALCYVIQNNLLFFALSKLDAATYQVTYQLKILTTAFFAVVVLKQKLIMLKWVALVFLTVGVALVQLAQSHRNEATNFTVTALSAGSGGSGAWDGLIALLAACFLSGFSGIYMEKLLKHTDVSLWMRNTQLAFFSIFGAFFVVWANDFDKVRLNGFFQGYNWIIWVVVLLQAYGGLLISLVVKFADNILKGFAVSLSIVLSGFVSAQFLHDFRPSFMFFLGASTVIASSFLYGYERKKVVPIISHAHNSSPSMPLQPTLSHDSLKKLGHYS